jgi:trehalose 6-phosphate phosphatase
LFLDFDGTLVEIAEQPDAVRISERLSAVLERLIDKLHGRVAIISGRPAAQVRAYLDLPITIVGSHGMEFEGASANQRTPQRPPALTEVLSLMRALAANRPGLMVEDKPYGIALHFRRAPTAEDECMGLAIELARKHQLHLQPGKMMVELRASGGDKGTAIGTLMQEPDRAFTRPVFMGDDHTDEPGFVAAAEFGGAGILIGAERPTAAQYCLAGVADVLAWLEVASAENA